MGKPLVSCDGPLTAADYQQPRKSTQPKGYARPPGTGPKGETCQGCSAVVRKQLSKKTVAKCRKAEAIWTGGRGSDILLRSPACELFEKGE